MRVLLPLALPLVLLAGSAAAPMAADGEMVILMPEQIGQIFCLSRTGNDTGPIVGLLTAELSAAIDRAWARNAEWEAANPGEKPPLGDGIQWQAWPDYAPSCRVGFVSLMKSDARVEIDHGFPDQPDANFTDTLLLRRVPVDNFGTAFWRIDNLAYATGGDLRDTLATAFDAR